MAFSTPTPENDQNPDLGMEMRESRGGDENVGWLRQQIRVFRNRTRGVTDQSQVAPATSIEEVYSPMERARREALQSVETQAEALLKWRHIKRVILENRIKVNNVLRQNLRSKVHYAPWKWFVRPKKKQKKQRYQGSVKDLVREARAETKAKGKDAKPPSLLSKAPLDAYQPLSRVTVERPLVKLGRWLRLVKRKEKEKPRSAINPHLLAKEVRAIRAKAPMTRREGNTTPEDSSEAPSEPVLVIPPSEPPGAVSTIGTVEKLEDPDSSDSSLDLGSEPVLAEESSISSLELPEDEDPLLTPSNEMFADEDDSSQTPPDVSQTLKKDEDFLLTPSDEMFADEDDPPQTPPPPANQLTDAELEEFLGSSPKSDVSNVQSPSPQREQQNYEYSGRSRFMELNEAANIIGVSPERLAEMRSDGEIRGFRDGATWKFKSDEVERVRVELDLELPALDSELALSDADEEILGRSDSDLELPEDDVIDLETPLDMDGSGTSSLELPKDDDL